MRFGAIKLNIIMNLLLLVPAQFISEFVIQLTLWEPAYGIFVLGFRPKNNSFRLPYQRPSSSADCARELFKGSKGSASLVDCTRKKFFWLGGADFLWLTS